MNADITDAEIDFILQELEKGIKKTFDTQLAIANRRIYNKKKRKPTSGRLKQCLEDAKYKVWSDNIGIHGHMDYPMYIRFLDMKRLGNMRIYNRPIWGIFYKETMKTVYRTFNHLFARINVKLENALP